MIVTLHEYGVSGNVRVYLLADNIESIHTNEISGFNKPTTILRMKNGNSLAVTESPEEVLEILQEVLPKRWEFL